MNGFVLAYWLLVLSAPGPYDNALAGTYPSLNACEQAVYNVSTAALPVQGSPRCVAVWQAPSPPAAKAKK